VNAIDEQKRIENSENANKEVPRSEIKASRHAWPSLHAHIISTERDGKPQKDLEAREREEPS